MTNFNKIYDGSDAVYDFFDWGAIGELHKAVGDEYSSLLWYRTPEVNWPSTPSPRSNFAQQMMNGEKNMDNQSHIILMCMDCTIYMSFFTSLIVILIQELIKL